MEFDEYSSADGATNIAYELSYRSLVSGIWSVSQDSVLPRDVVYLVQVKVDPGKTIASGFFRLGYGHSSDLPPDNDAPTYSSAIPFDASPAQFTAALSSLQGIQVSQVTRCQEGYADLAVPCPFASQGAFQWLVYLDQPIALETNLYVLGWSLGDTWTGVGPQVQISRFQLGMVASNQCIAGTCRRNVTGLRPAMGYSFRVRVLTTGGWSEYSPSSNYVSTLEARAPSRPAAPSLIAVYNNYASLSTATPPSVEGVTTALSQYRIVGTGAWINGPDVQFLSDRGYEILSVGPLSVGVYYEVRVQTLNHFGLSPQSSASQPFQLNEFIVSNLSIDSLFSITGITYDVANISVHADPRIILGTNVFKIQYRSPFDVDWILGSNLATLTSSIPGVLKQNISSRKDNGIDCNGYFKLSLGTVDPTFLDDSVTPELAFDASVIAIKEALEGLRLVKENSLPVNIIVTQRINEFNGFTWTVELHQLDPGATLQLFRSIFSSNSGESCFSFGSTVVIDLVSDGTPTFLHPSAVILVGSLRQQTPYKFRLVVTDKDGNSVYSGAKNATTAVQLIEANVEGQTTQLSLSSTFNRVVGGSETKAASGQAPANDNDMYYREGVATGGNLGSSGGSGLCLAIKHDLYKVYDFSLRYYFYDGHPQGLSVPSTVSDTSLLTFKCWGGGGGGAFSSLGGGGGFAQITVRTKGGDIFLISVAGGGRSLVLV